MLRDCDAAFCDGTLDLRDRGDVMAAVFDERRAPLVIAT